MNAKQLAGMLAKMRKDSITVKFQKPVGQSAIGSSKFGGYPHLPEGFEWPYFEGSTYDDVTSNRPLSFLAQINLKDVSAYDTEHVLPAQGWLYFFYETETMLWGFDPKDKGCARVYFHDAGTANLKETRPPKDMPRDYVFPELLFSFDTKPNLPDFEEFAEHYVDCACDQYEAAQNSLGYFRPDTDDNYTKLLGYADIIQNDMLTECEKVTRGVYTGDGSVKLGRKQSKEIHKRSTDWTLLFQMGTVNNEEGFELMWGDCGCIYFYIRKSDLQCRNFNEVWLILQCY